jgi:RHS repeat-associated protein
MAAISSQTVTRPGNLYHYNSKEFQHQEFSNGAGLEWYDYSARMYDIQIGRWHNQDRFSEKHSDQSPYNLSMNDPIDLVDIIKSLPHRY